MGEHAQRDHDVAEVGGDGAHGHPHLARAQRRAGVGNRLQLQILEGARAAQPQPPRPVGRRHQDAVCGAAGVHPRRIGLPVAQHYLWLTDRQGRRYRRSVDRSVGINQDQPAWVLGLRRAHQSPYRRAGQIGDVLAGQRHGAPGGHHQHARIMFGQPRLHSRQRLMGAPIGPAERIAVSRNGFKEFIGGCRIGGGNRHRRPDHLEQPVWTGCGHHGAHLLLAYRAGHHRLDRKHRQTKVVGEFHRDRRGANRRDPYPHRRGPRRVQRHALPGERQHQVRVGIGDHRGVQRGIQQRRVHAETAGRSGRLGQPDFGEQLLATRPHRSQSTERGPIPVPTCIQPLVPVSHVDRDGSSGRPGRQVGRGLGGVGAQGSLGVADPHRAGVGVGAGVDRHAALRRIGGGTDDHLYRNRTRCREYQRRAQCEFVDHRAADFVAGPDCQLDKPGAGKHHYPRHRVIGQPAVRAERQAAGQHDTARFRKLHDSAQQRMPAGAQPQSGCVDADALSGEPKAPLLKGIRGKLDQAGTVERAAPVHIHAGNEGRGGRRQESLQPTVFPTQGGHDDGVGTGIGRAVAIGVLDTGDQRGVRAGFDEGAVSVATRAAHGLVELHRLPDVAVPVLGIQLCCVQATSGHRREERGPRRKRLDPSQNFGQLAFDRFHLDRVRRIVHIDATGAQLPVRALRDQLLERCHLAGDHHGRRAVDGGDADPIAKGLQQLPRLLLATGHRHHAARSGQSDKQLAAQGDHLGGIAQRQRTGHICGSDLALRVPDDGIRAHPDRLPQFGQRHHHRKQHRLHDVDPVKPGCPRSAAEHVEQRPVDEFREGLAA
ncbi:hypothetical protein MMMB2_1474 [Mycobacterium marinum MB2]|nr:hypothetical protein MMMB2_1474 [Mycobacterium marinum MB2]